MKSKIGKVIAPILLVLLLMGVVLFVMFSPSQAVPIGGTYPERIGAFTGPVGGTAQDDNIKASLDLAHTDLDAMITYDTDVLSLLGLGNGNVYYVDASVAGSAGTTWATAVATIDAAVNLVAAATEADTHAIILVAPGHTETLGTGADGCDVDQTDVTIIGLGKGENRPKIDYDTATDEFVIGADDVVIRNLWFHANVDSVVKAIDVEANCENWAIIDCVFDTETPGTDEFDDAILTNAGCYGGLIKNCLFDMGGTSNANTQSAICMLDSDYTLIEGNRIFGDYAVACIEQKTTAADFLTIRDNLLVNGIIGGTAGLNTVACISLADDSQAIITDNRCFTNVATPNLAIVAPDGLLSGNTYCETEGPAAGSVPIGSASVGERCVQKSLSTIANGANNLFAVSGGPIKMTEFVIYIDSVVQTQATLVGGNIDPTTPATDTTFGTDGTAVDFTAAAAGTVFTWDGVLATDFAKQANGVVLGMGTDISYGLFVPVGMIELTSSAASTGTLTVYMTYLPLGPHSIVTPQ